MKQSAGMPAFIIGLTAVLLGIFFLPDFFSEREKEEILKTGLPAAAEILSIKDTGNRYNDQPEVTLKLKVTPPDETSYETHVTMYISQVYIPQFQPGKKLKVRYDANNKSKVAVEETESGQRAD